MSKSWTAPIGVKWTVAGKPRDFVSSIDRIASSQSFQESAKRFADLQAKHQAEADKGLAEWRAKLGFTDPGSSDMRREFGTYWGTP